MLSIKESIAVLMRNIGSCFHRKCGVSMIGHGRTEECTWLNGNKCGLSPARMRMCGLKENMIPDQRWKG